jgi:hypothetical protein
MNYVKIDGTVWDVAVSILEYEENFSVLDGENAGRVKANARMVRDIYGTFLGHKITFFRKGDHYAAFDALWDYLKQPRESVMLEAVDGQDSISYEAYTDDCRLLFCRRLLFRGGI